MQEEYSALATLESRLQEVARGMVSQQGAGRPWQARPPQLGPPFTGQNGFPPQLQHPGGQPGLQPALPGLGEFSSGHPAQPGRLQQQPGAAEQPAAGAAGMPSIPALPGSLGQAQVMSMAHSQSSSLKQEAPQLAGSGAQHPSQQHLASTGPVKAESQQNGGPHPGAATQAGGAGGGMAPSLNSPTLGQSSQQAMMANGKPVMLRGPRDWPAAQSPALPNVRLVCSRESVPSSTCAGRGRRCLLLVLKCMWCAGAAHAASTCPGPGPGPAAAAACRPPAVR